MQISELAELKIRGNNKAIGRLMQFFDKGERTILNWMERKDIRLTVPGCLKIIAEETGINENEILVESAATDLSYFLDKKATA